MVVFMPKVSVVIPVYNVEDYLSECLDSILNQTLSDIEVICINDGSTDDSMKILEEYANKDDRMQVYSQENSGHAVATNKGMSYARGKYLFLMDSDDTLELTALEQTYNLAEEYGVDFVIFKARNYDESKQEFTEVLSYSMDELCEEVGDKVFTYEDIKDLVFTMSVTPWSKLYNRQFIEKHAIEFPEGLIFDDNIFFWEALFNSEKLIFLDEFLFKRRYYPTSSTNNGDLRFLDSLTITKLKWKTFKKYGQFDYHKTNLYNSKISTAYMRYVYIKNEYKEIFFKEMQKEFKKMLQDEEVYNDFMNELTENNENIFRQVLSVENSESFNLLRDTYSSILKNGI